MTILLWILQFLLAAHTLLGALWKFSHPAQSLPSLQALPQSGWLGLAVAELLCSVALAVPLFLKSTSGLAPISCAASLTTDPALRTYLLENSS